MPKNPRRAVRTPLHRRTVLRGAAGAAVGLPFLEAMLPQLASAQDGPKRFVVAYAGMSAGCDRAASNQLRPAATGPGFEFRDAHAALREIKSHVSVVSGLRTPYGQGPGQHPGSFHSNQGWGPILSGNKGYHGGDSVDVVVANRLGTSTESKAPLSVRVQAQSYRWNEPPRGQVSHRGGALNEPFSSPAVLFGEMFRGRDIGGGDVDPALASRARRRRAVVGLVHDEAKRLSAKVSHADRQRLEKHISEIDALERRLAERSENAPMLTNACGAPSDPGADPGQQSHSFRNGDGMTVSAGWSDEDRRAALLVEMIRLSFACDYKRSVSMCISYMQTFMSNTFIPGGGNPSDIHEASHGFASAAEYDVLHNWHAEKFRDLVVALRDTEEAGATLLDRSALVMHYEGGFNPSGGGASKSHSHENMVSLIAGHAGGLRGGLHVDAGGEHPIKVSIAAMNAVGAGSVAGEVSGAIEGL